MLHRFNFVVSVNDSFHKINFKPALKVLSLHRFPNLPLSPSYFKENFVKESTRRSNNLFWQFKNAKMYCRPLIHNLKFLPTAANLPSYSPLHSAEDITDSYTDLIR
jgi:hypothetical protein